MNLDRCEALLDAIIDAALDGDDRAIRRLQQRLIGEMGDPTVTFSSWVAGPDGFQNIERLRSKSRSIAATLTSHFFAQTNGSAARAN